MTPETEPSDWPSRQRPVAKLATEMAVLPTDELAYESRKVQELVELLWLPRGLEERERNARILRALELYEELKPEGAAEGMLAEQMIGAHMAALECLRRAALPNQTAAGQDMALKQAQKLMSLYVQQMAALDKRRGRGQQRVVVEHVHVHSGGQAIVGTVETSAGRPAAPLALEQAREIPVAPTEAREPAPTARRGHR